MVALTRLTRALLPAMIEQKRGAILNVSSSASFLPIPNFAVYAATKAYVTSFSEALRSELHGTGIQRLGPLSRAGADGVHGSGAPPTSRTCAALSRSWFTCRSRRWSAAALRGIERNRPIVIPGWLMKIGMAIVRLTPMPLAPHGESLDRKPETRGLKGRSTPPRGAPTTARPSTLVRVFDRATVGRGSASRPACPPSLPQRRFHIIGCAGDIVRIGRRFAVDRAGVNQLSARINDIHVGRVGGGIFVADLAVGSSRKAVDFIFQSAICLFASSGVR